jgi:type II secretory pathway pseudopilin PulG
MREAAMVRTTMKREAGFSLLELMVSVSILVAVVGVTLKVLVDAQHANEGVSLLADLNANLRSSMVNMSRDIIQAGESIPQGGIGYPQGLAINWPSPPGKAYTYPLAPPLPQSTALMAVVPGDAEGLTVNGAVTDMIWMIYADNSLVDANGNMINSYPVTIASVSSTCAGLIAANGLTVAFDPNCIVITGDNAIVPGNLIMFTAPSGATTIQTVTSVAGQVVSFAAGDSFNFNGHVAAHISGSLYSLQTSPGSGLYGTTTATRVKLVTYYIDNTNPNLPLLMRKVNFQTSQAIGQGIESLQITYGITGSNNAALYGASGPANARYPMGTDTPTQIREVNLFVAGRSENAFSQGGQFFRDNMVTKVCVRSLSFVNRYN